ncbi:MAG: hypothetical protein J3R72DRAFT_429593 [Linnemannia gamsii]|nr:MAG: hypothetical protein J3R72DRAFT_429593 [Linnemannia gamsii]
MKDEGRDVALTSRLGSIHQYMNDMNNDMKMGEQGERRGDKVVSWTSYSYLNNTFHIANGIFIVMSSPPQTRRPHPLIVIGNCLLPSSFFFSSVLSFTPSSLRAYMRICPFGNKSTTHEISSSNEKRRERKREKEKRDK